MVRSSALLAPLLLGAATPPHGCDLPQTFRQADPRGARTVRYDASALVSSSAMKVDADGGPRTYSLVDPEARLCDPAVHPENAGKNPAALGCAMDKLCYGASVRTPAGTLDYHRCADMTAAFRRLRAAAWTKLPGYALLPVGIEMKDADRHVPCENGSYLVSTSSTPSGLGGAACSQARWLDTLVPSLVVPKCWSSPYRLKNPKTCARLPAPGVDPDVHPGDLVAARGRTSGRLVFGVVGDLGPNAALGEASVGLLMAMAGRSDPPRHVGETEALDGREQIDVVVFKHSRLSGPLTLDTLPTITAAAESTFVRWSGSADMAGERLIACGRAVSP